MIRISNKFILIFILKIIKVFIILTNNKSIILTNSNSVRPPSQKFKCTMNKSKILNSTMEYFPLYFYIISYLLLYFIQISN